MLYNLIAAAQSETRILDETTPRANIFWFSVVQGVRTSLQAHKFMAYAQWVAVDFSFVKSILLLASTFVMTMAQACTNNTHAVADAMSSLHIIGGAITSTSQ